MILSSKKYQKISKNHEKAKEGRERRETKMENRVMLNNNKTVFRHCPEVATALQVRHDSFPTAGKRWVYKHFSNFQQKLSLEYPDGFHEYYIFDQTRFLENGAKECIV